MARGRLAEERKSWRKDKPFGFHARPETVSDGCGPALAVWTNVAPAWTADTARLHRLFTQDCQLDEVELSYTWEVRHRLGGGVLPLDDGVLRRLPNQAPEGQPQQACMVLLPIMNPAHT